MAKKNKAEAAAPEKKKSKGLLFFLGVLTVVGSALVVVLGAVLYMVNPWYIPQILKRNYPEWFEAHPTQNTKKDPRSFERGSFVFPLCSRFTA